VTLPAFGVLSSSEAWNAREYCTPMSERQSKQYLLARKLDRGVSNVILRQEDFKNQSCIVDGLRMISCSIRRDVSTISLRIYALYLMVLDLVSLHG
jgi:hypothetical protein